MVDGNKAAADVELRHRTIQRGDGDEGGRRTARTLHFRHCWSDFQQNFRKKKYLETILNAGISVFAITSKMLTPSTLLLFSQILEITLEKQSKIIFKNKTSIIGKDLTWNKEEEEKKQSKKQRELKVVGYLSYSPHSFYPSGGNDNRSEAFWSNFLIKLFFINLSWGSTLWTLHHDSLEN